MTPWILLRGLSREARHWGEFPRNLGEATGNCPVICLDLPGNGALNRMPSPASVEAMADFCHGELARMDTGRPCRILAMSLGAMVAVAWAARHPGDVAAAVLINTSLRPFSPVHHRLRPANYPRLLRLLLAAADDREVETAILNMTSRLVANPVAVVGEWLRWRRENPVSRRNALLQLLAAARFRAPAQRPLKHMLLLAAAADGLVDPRCSQVLAERWQVALELHPAAGHDLALDDADWVLARVGEWLATAADGPLQHR